MVMGIIALSESIMVLGIIVVFFLLQTTLIPGLLIL